MTLATNPRTRKLRLFAVALASLALVCAFAAGLFYYLRLRERPLPTQTVWRSRVLTLAGDGAPGSQDDSNASHAHFADPFGVAVDKQGNVFVTDAGASNRIRKIDARGAVTTLAGGAEGFADGAGGAASFNTPSGIALDHTGNLYVADTANNRIRRVAPDGNVTTVAGDGSSSFRDGNVSEAEFNAPVGVATDERGNFFVADTYNDRIRVITSAGEVKTVAGGDSPSFADGDGTTARFDTPCGVAVAPTGDLYVADTGNNRIRKVTHSGAPQGFVVTTLDLHAPDGSSVELHSPVGVAVTHDNFLYVTEQSHGRVWQIAPDQTARVIAGAGSGFADGDGQMEARFNQPAGIAVDREGALYVADGANYLVRKIAASQTITNDSANREDGAAGNTNGGGATAGAATNGNSSAQAQLVPRLDPAALGIARLPYPVDPQNSRHEITALMGEVRGSFDSTDQRDHLHAGIDVFAPDGATARAVFDEKVAGVISSWNLGTLNEGLRVGAFTYYHLRVGRGKDDRPYVDPRFINVFDDQKKLVRVRVRRGTRFRVGDALGTVNTMYHVHLNFGPPGNEINPLTLPLIDFSDTRAPLIAPDGVRIYDSSGKQITEKRGGRLVVRGAVRVVVEAYDQVDGNAARRRLGLYRLGFQLLRADGTGAQGFGGPRVNIEFDRLPPLRDAVKIAYADESGITVYGNKETRFFYEVTNAVGHG
ncbi:MAG: NHL repeat-containing protein, partial [Acidobacteriota bacterium]|nr:NHL repeat-containing protein [Acidobacteriota bacterium]